MIWVDKYTADSLDGTVVSGPPCIETSHTMWDAWTWCEEHHSTGCFHFYPSTGWWMEYEKDALLFTLKWGT